MKAFLLFCMIVISLSSVSALDLATALAEATATNPGLQAERLRLGTLERSKNSAFQNLYPEITAGAGWQRWNDTSNQVRTVLIPQNNGTYQPFPFTPDPESIGLALKAQITLNLASFAAIDKARADFDAGRIKLLGYQNTIRHEVKATFYRILFLQKSLELSKAQVDTAQARFTQVDAAYHAGSAPELNLLQTRIGLENRKSEVRSAEYAIAQARYGLCILLGRTPDKSLEIDGILDPKLPTKPLDAAHLSIRYGDSRADIAGLSAQKEILSIQSTQIAGLIVPQVVIGWTADPALNKPGAKDISDTSLWSQTNGELSVQVQWKLDSLLPGSTFWTNTANIEDQKTAILKNQNQARAAATAQILGIVERMEQSRVSLPALEANARDAQRAAHLAQIAFTAGVQRLVEAQDADVQARAAELGLLSEKLSLQLALIDLEQALETPLEDINELQ